MISYRLIENINKTTIALVYCTQWNIFQVWKEASTSELFLTLLLLLLYCVSITISIILYRFLLITDGGQSFLENMV